MEKDVVLESRGTNETLVARDEDATHNIEEALPIHLLSSPHPKKWGALKLTTYSRAFDLKDDLHNFKIDMEDITDHRDIWC